MYSSRAAQQTETLPWPARAQPHRVAPCCSGVATAAAGADFAAAGADFAAAEGERRSYVLPLPFALLPMLSRCRRFLPPQRSWFLHPLSLSAGALAEDPP